MTAAFPRAWFRCCSHCDHAPDVGGDHDTRDGHAVPCLVCQTESPTLFGDES